MTLAVDTPSPLISVMTTFSDEIAADPDGSHCAEGSFFVNQRITDNFVPQKKINPCAMAGGG